MRGNVLPARPVRRHRSTRRRQDAPDLPRRKITPRTIGKTYTAPDGKTFRPSMFITLTCPSYGRVGSDGTPADPARYDYQRAARDALHFAALFDRFIQNLRRFLGYDVQYFAAVEPQRRLAPHIHIAMRGTLSRTELRQVLAATYHQVWWPPTDTIKHDDAEPAGLARGQRQLPRPRRPAKSCPPGTRPSTPSAPDDEPLHVARFGERFDAQGVLAGSRDADRCIGYLTKYLTKHVADCHQAQTPRPARARRTARRRAAVRAVLADVRELAALRRPAQEPPARACAPGAARARPTAANTSATPDAASWSPANGPARPSPTTAPTGAHWLIDTLGLPATDPPATPGNPSPPATPTTCPTPAAPARRRRPATLARRTDRGPGRASGQQAAGSFGNREGGVMAGQTGNADRLLTVEAAAERMSTSLVSSGA